MADAENTVVPPCFKPTGETKHLQVPPRTLPDGVDRLPPAVADVERTADARAEAITALSMTLLEALPRKHRVRWLGALMKARSDGLPGADDAYRIIAAWRR